MVKRIALLVTLAMVSGCELGSSTIPASDPMIVVHAVLNPALPFQTILVEESLTGRQFVVDSGPYSPDNPIATGNGVPVGGALVTLTDQGGRVLTPREIRGAGNTATGIYQFQVPDTTWIVPGGQYFLTVQAQGMTVTGRTRVPTATPVRGLIASPFNRDQQSVDLNLPNLPDARAFWLRIEAPVSAFSLFTLDRELSISGNSRNLFTEDLLNVFFPGFEQDVTVAAVDSNVYDYYRSANDPFSGAGLISRLVGGLGLFGSVVVVEHRRLFVTQDPTGDPIEDTFTLRTSGAGANALRTFRLYLESKGPSATSGDQISGTYSRGSGGSFTSGPAYGTRTGETLELLLFESGSTTDFEGRFTGTVRGDTIRGSMANTGQLLFVRLGK